MSELNECPAPNQHWDDFSGHPIGLMLLGLTTQPRFCIENPGRSSPRTEVRLRSQKGLAPTLLVSQRYDGQSLIVASAVAGTRCRE